MQTQTSQLQHEVEYNPFKQINDRITELFTIINELKKGESSLELRTQEEDQLLTLDEAADYLKLSVPSIYRLCKDAQLPSFKKGRKILFYKAELKAWVMEGRRGGDTETDSDTLLSPAQVKKLHK